MAKVRSGKLRVIVGLCIVTLAFALSIAMLSLPDTLRRGIIATLHNRFDSDVQIEHLQIGVFPHIHATAQGIVLRLNGRTDVPPLITIEKFALDANLLGLLHKHVSRIRMESLQIHVPPHPLPPLPSPVRRRQKIRLPLVIDQIVSENALLETLPRDRKHVPRDFNIHHLVLNSFSFDGPASFHATLTNPLPLGEIDTVGQFGPWLAERPGDTRLSGEFRYSHADFNSIRGLSGIMSSAGRYEGVLDQINVEGDTAMPDFALDIAGNAVSLTTHYIAVVDGTNGDTYLQSVDAQLGDSPLSVSGHIVGIPGIYGKHIVLDATSRNARAEDLLRLAVKGGSPLDGSIDLHAHIDVSPARAGQNVIDRLSLNGQFGFGHTRFTDPAVQRKLDSLSRAGQGQPRNEDIKDVISNLRGSIVVRRGVARLSGIRFDVPGAIVQLAGSYNMKSADMDFHGHLDIDVKLSQTTRGAKSVVLNLFDPFFRKNGGGSSIPIHIIGIRSQPRFGLDLNRKRAARADGHDAIHK
jgi:hypothetical protein